jgi:DNA repair protein SbcC/Rad50
MRLNHLHLANFRQHVDTRIDFDSGITGIIGPNGSGKSTLLEAIAWALYGTPAARGTRESIKWLRAGPRAQVRVDLDFELSGHRYLVSRGLNNAEVYLDGSATPIATSISAVRDLLSRRLGMTHDEFFNTYFTGQKQLGVMAAMGPTERAQFLSRVLGYERLRVAQELVRKRRSAIEAETKGLRAGMLDPEQVRRTLLEAGERLKVATARLGTATERRAYASEALEQVAPQWERIQRERETFLATEAELRVAEGDRTARERDRERIQRELAEIATARQELQRIANDLAPLPALQLELRELEKASSEEARRRTLTESVRVIADELSRLGARRGEITVTPESEAEATKDLATARTALDETQAKLDTTQADWVRDKQEAETKLQALRKQVLDVKEQRDQIINLGENGTCPICARPLGTHFRQVLDLLENQIETITFDGKYYRSRMEQLAATPPEIVALTERRTELSEQVRTFERGLAKMQAEVQELRGLTRDLDAKEKRHAALASELASLAVQYDAARHAQVKATVDQLAPLAARATKLQGTLEREQTLAPELDRVAAALVEIGTRIADLDRRRSLLAFSEQSFASMRETYERAAEALRTAELAFVAAEAEATNAQMALESAEQARTDLERAEARLAELTKERRLHDELDRAFGDIRTDLNQELRPELSDRASRYIRELTDGRYTELELDEQYNVIVLEDAIPKPVISGGEEDLANLVLRLAISEMIAERAGQAFSLLILDEVFGSLDETRRDNVVALMHRLQEHFEQIILITHVDVRRGLHRTIAVRYDEELGASSVETDPSGGTLPFAAEEGVA